MTWLPEFAAAGSWQDLPREAGRGGAAAPFAGVAERDLLEADAVVPGHPGDVQVAVDDRGGVIAQMPVCGSGGAAPLREHWIAQHPGGLADQRVVGDEDDRERGVPVCELFLGGLYPGRAPLFDGVVGIGVQQRLVAAHDAFLVRQLQALLLGQRAVRPERVVVQQEHRRDRHRTARAVPYRVGVLWGSYADFSAELD